MLTVACVLRSGGIYDATWVDRLRAGVARHLPFAHKFVCFSDVDVPCERYQLFHGWAGWWSKIEALRARGPVLMFDLDTVIVGDLSDVAHAAMRMPFVALRDFYRPGGLGSGVLGWNAENQPSRFYQIFAGAADHWIEACGLGGDQNFIERVCAAAVRWQDIVGDQIVSYKVHCGNGIPPNARVVCLHGRPKFADMPANDPVRRTWETAA